MGQMITKKFTVPADQRVVPEPEVVYMCYQN